MKGHAMLELKDAFRNYTIMAKCPNPVKNSSSEKRTRAPREIVLARALYKCGDYKNVGEYILENYQKRTCGILPVMQTKF